MYRQWRKELKAFAKESRKISRKIQIQCRKCKDVKQLRLAHEEYIAFITQLENTILDSHMALDNFFDEKVNLTQIYII